MAPLNLNLGTTWGWVASVTSELLYSFKRRLSGLQIRSARFGGEKNLLPLTGIRTLDRPTCSLVKV